MKYTIKNDDLTVVINSIGAELNSIKSVDGTEYLWQGDPSVWEGQAPNLFPYIARMTKSTYTFQGKEYKMPIHGFINLVELSVKDAAENRITFTYSSNDETLACYPFQFTYLITYALEGNVLRIENQVINQDEKRMYFGIGGHPGFCVPLEEGLTFEDYRLEFDAKAQPSRVIFTEDCFLTGKEELYPLQEDRYIPLHHNLFDQDAIVLKNAAHAVTICSDKGKKAVKVSYPDVNVIGFWHMPEMEAPYVCIEPWSSLPSRKDVVEEISQQSDLISVKPGNTYQCNWEVEIRG